MTNREWRERETERLIRAIQLVDHISAEHRSNCDVCWDTEGKDGCEVEDLMAQAEAALTKAVTMEQARARIAPRPAPMTVSTFEDFLEATIRGMQRDFPCR